MTKLVQIVEWHEPYEIALQGRLACAIQYLGLYVLQEVPVPPMQYRNVHTDTIVEKSGRADLVIDVPGDGFVVIECKIKASGFDLESDRNPLFQLGDYLDAYDRAFPDETFRGMVVSKKAEEATSHLVESPNRLVDHRITVTNFDGAMDYFKQLI